ncbi:DNA/RNA helicase domain-containing protein [Nonomuraea sp. NPDC049695]|uniref:DNA/RNA helicase domain-containing protein n=1 Tax=Nonomuraea sp. NPDC049695 TaxID=3154734 RepID=UPI003439C55C
MRTWADRLPITGWHRASQLATYAAKRTARQKLDQLMSAAQVPVFLLDEHQVVQPGKLGTVESIERYDRHVEDQQPALVRGHHSSPTQTPRSCQCLGAFA